MDRRSSLYLSTVLVLMILTSACGQGGDDVSAEASFADSAGVTIVQNPDPAPEARLGWTLSPDPLVDIGGLDAEEEYQVFRSWDAHRLPDGRLAVLNGGSGEIRVYEEGGTHLYTWGGEGDGPGEFRFPFALSPWPGDSLAVWDSSLRRLSLLDSEGAYGRQINIGEGGWSGVLQWHAAFPDGASFISHQDIFSEPPSTGVRRHPTTVVLLDAEGEVLAELPAQPGDEIYMQAEEGRMEIMRFPFFRGFMIAAWGESIVFGPTDRPEVAVYDRAGSLVRLIRLAAPPRPVTEADRQAQIERMVAAAPADARAATRTRYRDMPTPEFFPTFDRALADSQGNLWVRLFTPPVEGEGETRVWAVFGPEGRILGRVETPAGVRVLRVGDDFIVGHFNDELDVEHIQVWGLDRN